MNERGPAPSLEGLFLEYQKILGPGGTGVEELRRFRTFLLRHGGLGRQEVPGGESRLLAGTRQLKCFHFSQYLDWYLVEKVGVSDASLREARETLNRFNEWLFTQAAISSVAREENRESILGTPEPPGEFEEGAAPPGEDEPADPLGELREEQDFDVPGEYTNLLSGEFVLTQVQEGILYGIREGDLRETGPILASRTISGGSRVGDRVHLSLGKAGDHWNLLGFGRKS